LLDPEEFRRLLVLVTFFMLEVIDATPSIAFIKPVGFPTLFGWPF
jgi:hypothetical protein